MVDGRRNGAARDRQDQDGGLHRAGRSQTMPNHRFERGHRNPGGPLAEDAAEAPCLGDVILRRGGPVRVDVIHGVGVNARVAQRQADDARHRPALGLRRGRMKRLARQPVARQLRVDARAAAARAVEILQHQDAGAFADVHAGAAAIERPARRHVHQAQQVEPAEGQPRERIGPAGQRRIRPARANRFHGPPDRDRARRAGRDDARARSFQVEPLCDDVHRRAREMVPHVRASRAFEAGRDPGPIELLVSQQVGGAGAEKDADAGAIHGALEQAGVGQRLAGRVQANPIAARPASAMERRGGTVERVHVDFRGHAAAVSLGVEDSGRTDAAFALEHAAPALLPRRAERGDQPDAGDRDPRVHDRASICIADPAGDPAARCARVCATCRPSRALPAMAIVSGRN